MKKKRATIKDVAARAKVAISVVSYVLNKKEGISVTQATRERILKAAKELEYTPNAFARTMRSRRSMNIGLVSWWNHTDYVFGKLLQGISKKAEDLGYNLLFCAMRDNSNTPEYVKLFKQQQIDGVIFIAPHDGIEDFDEDFHVLKIKELNIPALIINGSTRENDISYIDFDFVDSGYKATTYLLDKGYKNISYLYPSSNQMNQSQAHERFDGYMKALQDHSITTNSSFKEEDVDELCKLIKSGKGPEALVTNKSECAHSFYKAALRHNISIPDDIAVIAANTQYFSRYLIPALTTVELPLIEIGEQAVTNLLQVINKKSTNTCLTLPGSIAERESCQ